MSKTPEYNSWAQMKQRCENPADDGWDGYGGRGIKVCQRWRRFFAEYYADMGDRPFGHTLDRIDNDGHYSCGKCEECIANGWPMNCQWSTPKQQSNNTRHNVYIEHDGLRLNIQQWSERTGLSHNRIYDRIFRMGWSVKDALTTKPGDLRYRGQRGKVGEYNGDRLRLIEWAEKYGMKWGTLRNRLFRLKWSIEKALTTPVRNKLHALQMLLIQLPPNTLVKMTEPSSG